MRFALPRWPAEFELPDDWWSEAGMTRFVMSGEAYSAASATMVRLFDVEPPFRNPECPLDWRGFNRERMINVLSGIALGVEIPPIPVVALASADYPVAPFAYRVCDGYHRFYASVAAGFEMLPVVIR